MTESHRHSYNSFLVIIQNVFINICMSKTYTDQGYETIDELINKLIKCSQRYLGIRRIYGQHSGVVISTVASQLKRRVGFLQTLRLPPTVQRRA